MNDDSSSSVHAPLLNDPAAPRAGRPWILLTLSGVALVAAPFILLIAAGSSPSMLWLRWCAILALGWWLPGALLVALWRLDGIDLPLAGVLALGLGLCWLILVLLVVHWWPGAIEPPVLVAAYTLGGLALTVALARRPPLPLTPTSARTWAWLAALLVIAGVLRLPGLGYHEFHFDEVVVLTRAREAMRGEDDAFARHTKGPGELAVAAAVYGAVGTIDEGMARLPFGLASVGGILALALLARSLFDAPTAFWSGVLLALNGFALGLSRILQYQAGVLLLTALAVLAMWMFAHRGARRSSSQGRWLGLALLLSAFGLVLHYEFALLAPALLWLFWRGWRQSTDRRNLLRWLAAAGVPAAALVAAVYVPAALHPYFADRTQVYLGLRLGRIGQTFNAAFFAEMATFYNSIYFCVGLLLLAVLGLWLGWRARRSAVAVLVLWFAPYLLAYLFLIEHPGTHFYLLMPSGSILAALPLAHLTARWAPTPQRAGRTRLVAGLAVALVLVWLAVSANYLYLMFFRQSPEYLVNYAKERVPWYWAPYGANVPAKPRFGFPILEGWKTLGVLSEWKYLNGTYASNDRSRHLQWYLGELEDVEIGQRPDFIFVARHVQEPDPFFDDDAWLAGYTQVGEVRVRGEPRIALWARQPLPVPFVTYDAENFAQVFDRQALEADGWLNPAPGAQNVGLGDAMTLVQAGFAPHAARPGDLLHVDARWQPRRPLDRNYKLFVHVAHASGQPLAQWDGLPGMNMAATSTWSMDQSFHDHVLLRLPGDLPVGGYRVLIGMYDPESGQRLGGQAVDLGALMVRNRWP